MLHKRARNQTCSPFRERGIKTAARYLLSPLTRAITKQSTHKEQVRARACMKQEPPTLFWGMDQATATMENSVQVLQTLKTELPHCWATPLLSLMSRKTIIWKDRCASKLTLHWWQEQAPKAAWTDARTGRWSQSVPWNRTQPRKWSTAFAATWVDQEVITLTEESQTGNNRLTMISFRDGF